MQLHTVPVPSRTLTLVLYVDRHGAVHANSDTQPSPIPAIVVNVAEDEPADTLAISFIGEGLQERFVPEHEASGRPRALSGHGELRCEFPIPKSGHHTWTVDPSVAGDRETPCVQLEINICRAESTNLIAGRLGADGYIRYAGQGATGPVEDHCNVDSRQRVTRNGQPVVALYYEVNHAYNVVPTARLVLHGSEFETNFQPLDSTWPAPIVHVGANETIVEFPLPSTPGQSWTWQSEPPTAQSTKYIKLKYKLKRLAPIT